MLAQLPRLGQRDRIDPIEARTTEVPRAQRRRVGESIQGHVAQRVRAQGGTDLLDTAVVRDQLGAELILWKALRIRSQADLERAEAYASVVDALLLDAWVPDQLGGTGHRIPIEWLEGFRPDLPWWLAGGITAERLPGALQALQAPPPVGVDASSGVERAPGDKDLDRVAQLVAAVAAVRQDRPT